VLRSVVNVEFGGVEISGVLFFLCISMGHQCVWISGRTVYFANRGWKMLVSEFGFVVFLCGC